MFYFNPCELNLLVILILYFLRLTAGSHSLTHSINLCLQLNKICSRSIHGSYSDLSRMTERGWRRYLTAMNFCVSAALLFRRALLRWDSYRACSQARSLSSPKQSLLTENRPRGRDLLSILVSHRCLLYRCGCADVLAGPTTALWGSSGWSPGKQSSWRWCVARRAAPGSAFAVSSLPSTSFCCGDHEVGNQRRWTIRWAWRLPSL